MLSGGAWGLVICGDGGDVDMGDVMVDMWVVDVDMLICGYGDMCRWGCWGYVDMLRCGSCWRCGEGMGTCKCVDGGLGSGETWIC